MPKAFDAGLVSALLVQTLSSLTLYRRVRPFAAAAACGAALEQQTDCCVTCGHFWDGGRLPLAKKTKVKLFTIVPFLQPLRSGPPTVTKNGISCPSRSGSAQHKTHTQQKLSTLEQNESPAGDVVSHGEKSMTTRKTLYPGAPHGFSGSTLPSGS